MNRLGRSLGSPTRTPALLLLIVATAYWLVGTSPAHIDWGTLALTWALVIAGCLALIAIRPQRAGLSPPHVMLTLGFGGMLAGLAWDVSNAGLIALEDLCAGTGILPYGDALRAHLAFLPGMHTGMIAGGLLAIPGLRVLRPDCGRYLCALFAQNLMCSGWMLIGMTGGALLLSRFAASDGYGLTEMLGGMFAGMTWGMVVSVGLYRGYFYLHDVRAAKSRS